MLENKIRCLIIDDEPIARKVLLNYITQMPILTCVGECKNALEALNILEGNTSVDLLFLDINMPKLDGMSLAKIVANRQLVIFTTAYSEYAVHSYEFNAVDYLLKPYLFERFAQAVIKASQLMKYKQIVAKEVNGLDVAQTIVIKSNGSLFNVLLSDIIFCEAMKNYTKVQLTNNRILYPLTPISKLEKEIAAQNDDFVRVHRSFLISKRYITSVGASIIELENYKVPIGNNYKEDLLNKIWRK